MKEATITIDGETLSEGQSMAVRVAITSFLFELENEKFRDDLGPGWMGYKQRLTEVVALILRGPA